MQPIGAPSSALQVYLLGTPLVTWAGHPLTISRRQVRALLYRLAAERQPIPREHLCYLFWADTYESVARRNLTLLLCHMGRALPDPDLLVASDDHVGLNPERAWSDTAAFNACACLKALPEAVGLYRGPFLSGFSLPDSPEFETWTSLERQAWEQGCLAALAALVEEHTARGDYAAAIGYARRYLSADELAEDMHRRLIALYAATGDRSSALRQFDRCTAVLERELGVRPLPETQAAYQSVLQDRPPAGANGASRPAWNTRPAGELPLVGRAEALRQLEQAYARACSGQGCAVLISGEAGVGKSRLMQNFAARLEGRALILAGGGCAAGGQNMPYQLIVDTLRPALSSGLTALDVSPTWLTEASRLLPELRSLYPSLPPPLPDELEPARTRLFEALCQLILGLAAGTRPLIVCLDDLHYADNTSLDWLAYLGRRLGGSRLLVVGAYTSQEAAALSPLREGLARLGILSELGLDGLDAAAILQLMRHLAGSAPMAEWPADDQILAERLRQVTGGNPFFLLETLRALKEAGRLGQAQPSG